MKRLLSSFAILATLFSAVPVRAATLAPGDLIKASGQTVYYYADNGKRYVFPTEKTYKSWYADFSTIKTITDAELANIAIGGNVTYRPGVRLVKVTTDPRVYAVDGRQLRWVMNEATAKTVFGDDWAKQVDDIPDAFFVNYTIGAEIDNTADYAPASVRSSYATIQATISSPAPSPIPTPTPTPTPSPTPTSTALGLTITLDKATAQSNESVFVLGKTTYTGGIQKLELFADDGLMTSCTASLCSGTWVVPTAGVKTSYVFRAKLLTSDGRTEEATTSSTIVSQPFHASIEMLVDRKIIRSGQAPVIRAAVTAGLTSERTEVYLDGVSVKACVSTPNDCRYEDYVFGTVGSTHEAYAVVRTPSNLYYRSKSIFITIGDNDSPLISLTAGRSEIVPGETVDVGISAQDDDGIASTEIRKDGQTLKTCSGAAPCVLLTGPWNVPSGTILTFMGMATDLRGISSTSTVSVTVR